jgi:hypothetical protein
MLFHEPPADRQSEARSLHHSTRNHVCLMERIEDQIALFPCDADTRVAHRYLPESIDTLSLDSDAPTMGA